MGAGQGSQIIGLPTNIREAGLENVEGKRRDFLKEEREGQEIGKRSSKKRKAEEERATSENQEIKEGQAQVGAETVRRVKKISQGRRGG